MNNWRGAGVVELARLESVCTPKGYRGFESLSLRKVLYKTDGVWNVEFGFEPSPKGEFARNQRLRAIPLSPQNFCYI